MSLSRVVSPSAELAPGAERSRSHGLGAQLDGAVARFRALERRRWGRFRRSAPGVLPPPRPRAVGAERWLRALARRLDQPYGPELVPVVLRGLGSQEGSCDLNDDEQLLPVHVLRLIWQTYTRLRQELPAAGHPPVLHRLCRVRALYGTWLGLRARGLARAGTPELESFTGCRAVDPGPHDPHRAFTWCKLADLVHLGVQDQLRAPGLHGHGAAVAAGDWEATVERGVLAVLFGEGQTWVELQALVAHAAGAVGEAALRAQVGALAAGIEPSFRRLCTPEALVELAAAVPLVAPDPAAALPAGAALDQVVRTHQERELRVAEAWLARRWTPTVRDRRVTGEQAWSELRAAVQSVVSIVAENGLWVDVLGDALARLDRSLLRARAALHRLPEFPWWPGDGEEYRLRRQRGAAAGDRLLHLMGLAERVLWACLGAETGPGDSLEPVRERMERGAAGMFIEEWTARYGLRLHEIHTTGRRSPALLPNRRLRDIDRAVRGLVTLARGAGGAPEHWGWVATGCTDRLRELVRREGPQGPTVRQLTALLRAGEVGGGERLVLDTGLPGALDGDADVPVTVGVHVFHADPEVVRRNLLRGRHLDWRPDRLRRLLGSSSAAPAVVEAERRICLETGTTHAFLSARRHKKAGNQNRLMASAPLDAQGRGLYLTLDDDFHVGSQLLQRAVVLAERFPRAAHIQLPMYLYGNHLPGISRARYADAAGMAIWGAWTSPGLRDLRLSPDALAGRRPLAVPFGTCTLLRLDRERSALVDTHGFHTASVTEDFAQGQVAFGMRYVHHPRKPENDFDDGILLDEVWAEGDGVELLGRVAQQTRWAEGSFRNALTIWTPVVLAAVRRAVGLHAAPGAPSPSLLQLLFGTLIFFGYGLELVSMLLLLFGFPLTAFIAEPTGLLVHSFVFWGGLWGIHMLFHGWMAAQAGLSVRTFLDQHFLRFAAIGGIARGLYRALRDPSREWAANKATDARLPRSTRLLYLGFAALNLVGLVVGLGKGMDVYLLCGLGMATALWPFLFLDAVPVETAARAMNLPRRLPRATLAAGMLRRQARRRSVDDRPSGAVPGATAAVIGVAVLTLAALGWRYWSLGLDLVGLVHRSPLFIGWLVLSDLCQLSSLGWLWFLAVAGVRSRPVFQWPALMAAAAKAPAPETPPEAPPEVEPVAWWRRAAGELGAWLVGRRARAPALGFVGASGLAVLVPVVAFALRVVHLDANSAFMDESFYVITGRRLLAGGDVSALLDVMFGSALYPLFAALLHALGGLWGARLGSAVLGALTALCVAQTTDRLAGRMAGLAAGLALAVLPQHIYLSALAMYDVLAVFFLALSLAMVATVLRGPGRERLSSRRVERVLALAGLVGLAAVLAKYVAAALLPALGVAVVVWSRRDAPERAGRRLLALVGPATLGAVVYTLASAARLQRWWAFARQYGTLVVDDRELLWKIYVVDGGEVLALGLLAVLGGAWMLLRSGRRGRGDLLVLGAGCAGFAAFQLATRADWNYGKHVTFVLPFLLPLTGAGVVWGGRLLRGLARHGGLPPGLARQSVHGAVVLVFAWLGLQGVDRVDGALSWWPDTRPAVATVAHTLPFGAWVLTDDTGAELGLVEAGFRVDTPFFAAAGFGAEDPVSAGVWGQRYDAVLLTGGTTRDGAALHRRLKRLLPAAGYRQVSGHGETGALWLRAPRAEPPSVVVAAQDSAMR